MSGGKESMKKQLLYKIAATFMIVMLALAALPVMRASAATIAQVGTATSASSTGSSITISKPSGVAAGNIMIANIALYCQGGGNSCNAFPATSLSGWTQITAQPGGNGRSYAAVLYKVAGASEGSSYTFLLSGNASTAEGAIVAFSGLDPTTPVDVVGTMSVSSGTSASVSAASITTLTTNAAVIMFGQSTHAGPTWSGWTTATSPGALTEIYDNQSSGGASVGAAWALKPTTGATGAGSATLSAADYNGRILIALRHLPGLAQTITITSSAPAGAVVAGSTYTPTATASSGLTVSYSIDPTAASVCSISGGIVSYTAVGTCVVDFNQAGNATYDAAPQVQQSFAVGKGSQTISFTSTAPVGAQVGGTYPPTAAATSGLTVALIIDVSASSYCSIISGVVHFNAVGTCLIDANQAGNANYNAAPQVQQSFAIAKGNQTISFTSTPPTNAVPGGTYTPTATATSVLTVTFTIDVSTSSICSIGPLNLVTFTTTGTCKIDADQAGNANYNAAPQVQQSVLIKTPQAIIVTSTAPVSAAVNGPTYTPTAESRTPNTSGSLTGLSVAITIDGSSSSTCSISGGIVSYIASGTCTIDFNQAGDATYAPAAQVQQAFSVAKATQAISFTSTAPVSAVVGGTGYTPTASATPSGLTVVFTIDSSASAICSYSTSTHAVTFTAVGTCMIDANQPGNASYQAATQVQQSFAVGKGSQTVTFTSTAPTNAAYNGPTYTVSATASSGLAVTFWIDSSATTVCSINASHVVSFIGNGTCAIDAYQAGNANYFAAPTVQQSFAVAKGIPPLTVSPVSAIYTGSPQSTHVTSTVAGSVSTIFYNGSSTVPTNAGTYVITAYFTSTDPNYSSYNASTGAGPASPNFVINQAAQNPLYVTGPASVGYGSRIPITSTGGSGQGTVTYSSGSSTSCSIYTDSTTHIQSINVGSNLSGTCAITATKAADTNYLAISSTPPFPVQLTLGTPTLYITNSPASYTGNPITAIVRAKTDTTDNISSVDPASILYDGDSTAPTDPGTYAVTADFTPTDTAHYVPLTGASAGDFVIAGLAQQITFTSTAPVGAVYGDIYTATAVSNSGLDVTITVDDAASVVCTINDNGDVEMIGLGTCIVDANQAGDAIYAAAPQVQQSFSVGTMSLTVTASADDKEYDGTTTATVTLDNDRVSGDDITVDYTSANFSDPAIGNDKTVTITGLTLSGPDSYKYTLPVTTITTTASIVAIIPRVADNGISYVLNGSTHQLDENMIIPSLMSQLKVTFNEDMFNVPSTDSSYAESVINPANYRLFFVQDNFYVRTTSCTDAANTFDHVMPIVSVSYSHGGGHGPYVATITFGPYTGGSANFNNGQLFRLFVCGTTSIQDLNEVTLAGDGSNPGTDFVRNFTLLGANLPYIAPTKIPATGFAPNRVTTLPRQPAAMAYAALGPVWLYIPKLGVESNIIGVPQVNGTWDVSWLNNDIGWLQGTAFPSLSGNSVLTSHYFNSYGAAGPFRYLAQLAVGDQIIVRAYRVNYVYQVRSLQQVDPANVTAMLRHEDKPWLTLVTCTDYLANNDFKYRLIVRAEFVGIQ